MNLDNMKKEFPHFPLLEPDEVSVLEEFGFIMDTSWHNECCPSLATEDDKWGIWIHHPVREKRESEDNSRFNLYPLDDGVIIGDEPVFSAETVQELQDRLTLWSQEERQLGLRLG